MERGRIQGLPKFFEYPLLSQERAKLRTSNFVGTFLVSIGTKFHYKFLEKYVVRTLKTFQCTHILGALCGLLCDSSAVLFFMVTEFRKTTFSAKVRFGRSRSSKVIDFRTNLKRICDFI